MSAALRLIELRYLPSVVGSVTAGSLSIGDEVEWLPRGEKVRVRSLQNHDRAVDQVHRGQRAAINLAGVHHEDVIRGQELARPGYLIPSRVVRNGFLRLRSPVGGDSCEVRERAIAPA